MTAAPAKTGAQRREEALAVQRALADGGARVLRYPPCGPLALGTDEELFVLADKLGISRSRVRRMLHRLTSSRAYLQALAKEGAVRRGLDGRAVEPVDPEHARHAAKVLAQWVERRAGGEADAPSPSRMTTTLPSYVTGVRRAPTGVNAAKPRLSVGSRS